MATQKMRLGVPRIILPAIGVSIYMVVTVSSVCLPDALSFYASGTACGFSKKKFADVFLDGTGRCQIYCSVDSQPSYEDMTLMHKITEMKIRFDSVANTVVLKKGWTCFNLLANLKININCEQREWQGGHCVDDNQCANKTANSTCNKISGLCQCVTGFLYLWETNTCAPAPGLGQPCINSRQSKEKIPHFISDSDKQCRCQQGYLKLNNSCSQARGLGEQCENYTQCNAATQHSMCNENKECRCRQGYIEVNNLCMRDVKTEAGKNYNSSVVIGVGVVCLLLGAALGGLVYCIITWNRRKTKLRSGKSNDDTTEKLSVQHMNSRLVYNVDSRDTEEGNDVYSHLHQDPIDINVESDYDHALQQMTAEDDYSHMNAHSKNLALEPDYYGETT